MKGNRLKKPKNCPVEMYSIMNDCWQTDPMERPTFATVKKRIEEDMPIRPAQSSCNIL